MVVREGGGPGGGVGDALAPGEAVRFRGRVPLGGCKRRCVAQGVFGVAREGGDVFNVTTGAFWMGDEC